MELCYRAKTEKGLSGQEILSGVLASIEGEKPKRALLLPPDFTRYHSNAGLITNMYYHVLTDRGCNVDIMPALGSHVPVTREQADKMFGDIPFEKFIAHSWRNDVVQIGRVPGELISEWTGGLWTEPVTAEINRRVMEDCYDLIISVGQVVPHEVIGMSNHAKNLFVGVGGSDMINKSHMIGAVYGMERMMGRDHTPVRRLFDYCLENFIKDRPIIFALTVTTAPGGDICTHGLFIGDTRKVLEEAIALSQKKNIDFVETGIRKCVVYLNPSEFRSTWLGNKAIYRTRMAIADGGELIVLAPGVERFGEDAEMDRLIRRYGYRGRLKVLESFKESTELRQNMGAAAHLIHGSSDGRFRITYAVKSITQDEMRRVGFDAVSYSEAVKKYDPQRLSYGYNSMEDGEEIYFIPNPALGLWIDRERFKN
ncbi:MAG: lactate racemase domain-containing protein [Clostridiales bacterium]|nr:lactate racemase domain-containing protein [Clostridiales bacterium]